MSINSNVSLKNLNSNHPLTLITSALPYANGPLHLGHVAGVYLPSDIFNRFLRMKNKKVIFISGSDAHGVPILLQAKKENNSPSAIFNKYHKSIQEDLNFLQIKFDYYGSTHNEKHFNLSQRFFKTLYKKGYLIKKNQQQFFCSNENIFLPDRYVIGTCPECNFVEARGDECSSCGEWLEAYKLINPHCQICKSIPQYKETDHWFFLLSKFTKELELWSSSESCVFSKEIKNFIQSKLKEGLPDRSITRDIEWGIPVPEFSDSIESSKEEESKEKISKCLYVWFEALLAYVSISKLYLEENPSLQKDLNINDIEDLWKNSNTKIYHFIGKDNLIFHALLFPSILKGQEESYQLPYNIICNEHLMFNDKKLSSSKKNSVLWVKDFIDLVPSDYLRYYLSCILPEKRDSSFSWEEFQEKINNQLNNQLGNLIHRVLHFINFYFNGILEEKNCNLLAEDLEWIDKFENIIPFINEDMENVEFKKGIHKIFNLINLSNQYFDYKKPWKVVKENLETTKIILKVVSFFIKKISIVLSPFLPSSSLKIWNFFHRKNPFQKPEEFKWYQLQEIKVGDLTETTATEILFHKLDNQFLEKIQGS